MEGNAFLCNCRQWFRAFGPLSRMMVQQWAMQHAIQFHGLTPEKAVEALTEIPNGT